MDFKNKDYYINRELSWLDFNYRVLEEAMDRQSPVMERMKFLAITASNLDEFFMVRVAGLKEQVEAGYTQKDPSGLNPEKQLSKITEAAHRFMDKQYSCYNRSIMPALIKQGIKFLTISELAKEQKTFVRDYFNRVVYPILTPLAVDQSRPFPLLSNKSISIGIRLKQDDKHIFAVVLMPDILDRVVRLPGDEYEFILLEEIIKDRVHLLFEGHDVKAVCPFRITRNADLSIDEEAEDLLIEIEKSIKLRKWGQPVRLEIQGKMDRRLEEFLISVLNVSNDDVYYIPGALDLTVWMKFSFLSGFDYLRIPSIVPQPAAFTWAIDDIFEAIKEKDRLVHHPYESFDCVVDFMQRAAVDPDVLAIKQSLYRVSGNSPVIDALIKAAEMGKQVTVLVELKARFDEENNILWAKKLERAGCHVIYGLVGLKTHCKILLVVRREEDGIRRYVHLSTGNYNDSTAKLYTDTGMFTCKETYGADASALFNLLTGYSKPPQWKKFKIAPFSLRKFFLEMIENEMEHAAKGREGSITAKMNSLVDQKIIEKLYKASCQGVKIMLIVRGICCLKPGIPGVSENIEVRSIVGQLLEHSRIFCFENAGKPKIYIGSADWMPRNLDRRVETVFPVEQSDTKARIIEMMDVTLRDTIKTRVMQPDGSYKRIDRRGKEALSSQIELSRLARAAIETIEQEKNLGLFEPKLKP